jgi:hypothetical protein
MPADYVPYGPEWEAEMMRMRKVDLVDMVRRAMAKEEKFTSYNKQSTPLSSTCIGCGAIISNVYCDDCRNKLSS